MLHWKCMFVNIHIVWCFLFVKISWESGNLKVMSKVFFQQIFYYFMKEKKKSIFKDYFWWISKLFFEQLEKCWVLISYWVVLGQYINANKKVEDFWQLFEGYTQKLRNNFLMISVFFQTIRIFLFLVNSICNKKRIIFHIYNCSNKKFQNIVTFFFTFSIYGRSANNFYHNIYIYLATRDKTKSSENGNIKKKKIIKFQWVLEINSTFNPLFLNVWKIYSIGKSMWK
jgi:hypothetical protein